MAKMIICENCSKEFFAENEHRKYCCPKCRADFVYKKEIVKSQLAQKQIEEKHQQQIEIKPVYLINPKCPICNHSHTELIKKIYSKDVYRCFCCGKSFAKNYYGLDVRKGIDVLIGEAEK